MDMVSDSEPTKGIEISFWRPAREQRRRLAGSACYGCGLHLHHKDILGVQGGNYTGWYHRPCLEILLASGQSEEEKTQTDPASQPRETAETQDNTEKSENAS